jgi:hypothetical protein
MHTGQDMDWRDKAFLIATNAPDLMVVSAAPGTDLPACQAFRSFKALAISPPLITLSCPHNR